MVTYYLALFVKIFLDVISFMIIARVLLSWVGNNIQHPIVTFIQDVTDPILNTFKKILPKMGMIDLSPLVALISIDLLQQLFLYLLNSASL